MLTRNNNSTGTISKENPQGIDSFIFYFGPGNGTGFRTESSSTAHTAQYMLHQLEVDPLYIINGKTYSSAQLDGKAIKVEGEVAAVNPEEAMKKYGAEAKSGALIISSGTIIEDFQAELKKIDEENSAVINEYIRIEKGKKPAVIGLNNSPGTYKVIRESRPSRQGKVINLKNLNTDGKKPIYIINGKVIKDDETVLKLSPEDIDSVQVLKGKNAVQHYGKDAKDGAILIFSKSDSIGNAGASTLRRFGNNKVRVSSGPTFTKDRNISITSARTIKNDTTYSRDSSFVKIREFRVNKDSVDIIGTQYGTRTSPQQQVIITNQGSEPLYIIDGKEMTKSFDLKSINPENISAINVLKNGSATRKYGEKAKHGVVVITTKDAEKNLVSGMKDLGIVKPSTTDGELEGIKSRLKDTGVNVKFEKVKRNTDGLITSIKISARTSNQNGSATFEVSDGIPPVYVGLLNDKLVVSSNPPRN
jgi:bla regulator protein blaR1